MELGWRGWCDGIWSCVEAVDLLVIEVWLGRIVRFVGEVVLVEKIDRWISVQGDGSPRAVHLPGRSQEDYHMVRKLAAQY